MTPTGQGSNPAVDPHGAYIRPLFPYGSLQSPYESHHVAMEALALAENI